MKKLIAEEKQIMDKIVRITRLELRNRNLIECVNIVAIEVRRIGMEYEMVIGIENLHETIEEDFANGVVEANVVNVRDHVRCIRDWTGVPIYLQMKRKFE